MPAPALHGDDDAANRLHQHWSLRLLKRDFQAEVICAKLRDSWTALGMISALVASMAYGELADALADPSSADVFLMLAFGLSIFCTINTVVLTAALNALPEEDLLKEFLIANAAWFRWETVIPFQAGMLCLIFAVMAKAPSMRAQNVAFFGSMAVYNFWRFYTLEQQATSLHAKVLGAKHRQQQPAAAAAAAATATATKTASAPPPVANNSVTDGGASKPLPTAESLPPLPPLPAQPPRQADKANKPSTTPVTAPPTTWTKPREAASTASREGSKRRLKWLF